MLYEVITAFTTILGWAYYGEKCWEYLVGARAARAQLRRVITSYSIHYTKLYDAQDLAFGDALPVVMTEKDAVKLRRAARPEWWVLPVHAVLEPGFGEWLLARLSEVV